MSPSIDRLSVPSRRDRPPRPFSVEEVNTYCEIADTLCPGNGEIDSPSGYQEFPAMLEVAANARSDAFDVIIGLLKGARIRSDLGVWLRNLHDQDPTSFQALSSVAAGAYLLIPAVREAIGYPGQGRNVPFIDEAANEIGDGILDPVLARGPFYVPTPQVGPS